MEYKVSLFASAVRPQFFKTFLDSLIDSSVKIEVVFAGYCTPEGIQPFLNEYPFFKYIYTASIKPAQCYEVARRACTGELIHWTADDCIYTPDFIGKAYHYWQSLNDRKAILSLQTKENGMFCDMRVHSYFGCRPETPLMAPLGLMSREFCNEIGGFDKRFICGQQENLCVMMALEKGGNVKIFGDKDNMIIIDHYKRHGIARPFAEGYNHDRAILESLYTDGAGKVLNKMKGEFMPFIDDGTLLEKSQSYNKKRWV